ncbi:MAG: alpha/beta hydrolase [Actinomycetota bacterium]
MTLVPDNAIVGGFRVAHGIHGAGEPLVLIHGTPSSSHIWRNVLPELVAAGYHVHILDLLGFGRSERPQEPSIDTSVTAQVDIVVELMDHWGLDHAHIVGHDIGGSTALRLAVFHPDRLRSLTVADPCSFDSWPSPRTKVQMAEGLDKLIAAPPNEHRAHFEEWLLSTVVDPTRLRAEALDHYLDQISGPIGQASLFHHQVRHYDERHTMELNDHLAGLTGFPVHIIWGADDAWQVLDWAHRLHAAIPGSHLTVIEDAGHFCMEDRPDAVAAAILGQLAA